MVEYKNEAYNAFQNLTAGMYEDYLRTLLRLQVAVKQEQPALAEDKSPLDGKVSYSSPEQALEQTGVGAARKQAAAAPPQVRGGEAPDVHEGQGRSLRQRRAQRAVPLRLGPQVQEVSRTRSIRNHG